MSFETLKNNRKTQIDKLLAAAESAGGNKTSADERYWTPTVDKTGNGYAVLRFLPSPDENGLPWAQWWDHGFKGPTGRWYFEKSLSSIGQPDPVMEMNSFLWNTGREEDKTQARDQKRKLHYCSNIMVISDAANPENDGKIFLFKFGKKIFDKIMETMQPAFEDEQPINPFDLWEGANFKLKIRNIEGYRNYDKSEFSETRCAGTDKQLRAIFDKLISLAEFSDPKTYKSYEELSKKLKEVMGPAGVPGLTTAEEVQKAVGKSKAAPSVGKTKASKIEDDPEEDNLSMGVGEDLNEAAASVDDGADSANMMDFFKKLAEDEE